MEDAKNIAKNYNPAEFEDKLYNEWVEKGYFHAEVDKNKKPFTINFIWDTHLTKHFRIFLSDTRECKVTVRYGFRVQTTPV